MHHNATNVQFCWILLKWAENKRSFVLADGSCCTQQDSHLDKFMMMDVVDLSRVSSHSMKNFRVNKLNFIENGNYARITIQSSQLLKGDRAGSHLDKWWWMYLSRVSSHCLMEKQKLCKNNNPTCNNVCCMYLSDFLAKIAGQNSVCLVVYLLHTAHSMYMYMYGIFFIPPSQKLHVFIGRVRNCFQWATQTWRSPSRLFHL